VAIVLAPTGALALPAIAATAAVDLVVFGAVWLALRPGPADITSPEQLARLVQAGQPVVVELYSNFCLICMANRQTIGLAATSLSGACRFVRVEFPTAAGSAIGEAFGCRYTPSYLVFDGQGELVRTIIPDTVTLVANGYRVLDKTGAVASRAPQVTPGLLIDLVRSLGENAG
jgi:hypothetical protein